MKFIELLCARLRWTSDQSNRLFFRICRAGSPGADSPDRKIQARAGRPHIAITQQEISEMVA